MERLLVCRLHPVNCNTAISRINKSCHSAQFQGYPVRGSINHMMLSSRLFCLFCIAAPEYRAPRTEYRYTVQSTPPCTQNTVHNLILVSTQGKCSAVAILTGVIVVIYRLCIPWIEYIYLVLGISITNNSFISLAIRLLTGSAG